MFFARCLQPGAPLHFCPQIEDTWHSTWGTFRFFVTNVRALCPQPETLLRVLPAN